MCPTLVPQSETSATPPPVDTFPPGRLGDDFAFEQIGPLMTVLIDYMQRAHVPDHLIARQLALKDQVTKCGEGQ